jgi:hypothetical protein
MNVGGPNHMQTFVQQAKFKKLYPEDGKSVQLQLLCRNRIFGNLLKN